LEHNEAAVVLELEVDGSKRRGGKGRKQHRAEGCCRIGVEAKCNVKTAAQGKCQKNHILIKGSDNGAISPVIQSTNRSRVPSSRPRTDVRPEGEDTRSNAEHKVDQK